MKIVVLQGDSAPLKVLRIVTTQGVNAMNITVLSNRLIAAYGDPSWQGFQLNYGTFIGQFYKPLL
jgi:hypothetical protein